MSIGTQEVSERPKPLSLQVRLPARDCCMIDEKATMNTVGE